MRTKKVKITPKTVSATEAISRFGFMLKWTNDNEDEVIIRVHGEPEGVLMSCKEYQTIEKLRERERKRVALAALRELREEVQSNLSGLSEGEVYELAGVSKEVANKIIARDKDDSSKGVISYEKI